MAATKDPRDALYTSDWPVETSAEQPIVEGRLNDEPPVDEWLPSSPRSSDPAPDGGYVIGESEIMADGQVGSTELAGGPERSNPEGSNDINNKQYWERSDTFR